MKYKKLDKRITKTALRVIESLCADYPRRKRIIECDFRTQTGDAAVEAFMQTNGVIDKALEVVDEGLREYILSDIINKNGYERSMASPFIAKNSYYRQRNDAIKQMALLFHLIF